MSHTDEKLGQQRMTSLGIAVADDQLLIRIGIGTLAWAFLTSEQNTPFDDAANDFRRTWKIPDEVKFAKSVMRALLAEEEDGSTPLTKLFDDVFVDAIEDGATEEDGRIITNEMIKEEWG